MTISEESWIKYIDDLRKVNDEAARLMLEFMDLHRDPDGLWNSREVRQAIIDYAYALASKYGEAAAELACEMYDAVGVLSDVIIPAAIPAETATYADIAKAVNGTLKQSTNMEMVASAVARQVKMVSVDTVMKNALRDGAEWAWIPHGDTCAFCITLASRGWQKASKKALKNGHAEHIHANCDCTYAVRFNNRTDVQGYDPDKYKRMYYDAPLDGQRATGKNRINAMRREFYADNKDRINAQKRSAYAKRKELEAPEVEEFNVSGLNEVYKNKYGQQITFTNEKSESTKTLKSLLDEYDSRLLTVEPGAERAAGDVDISGAKMRLSTKKQTSVLHEFAHTLANSTADKYGLTDDADFWKEIQKIRRQYMKAVENDPSKWITSYEHSQRGAGALDEFMAEAFAQTKAKEMGIELPKSYGNDFTYSKKVLEIINKYFKKK